MTRRSPEVVDGALGFQHHGSPRDASYVWEALDILADEVRALRVESDELRDIIKAVREELAAQRAKYKRDLSTHSCSSGGGPNMCGGCCECMERQFESGVEKHDNTVDTLRATIARVEALPKYWRETSLDRSRTWECAEDVERALKGDP